jgi:energy-coupling factor transporter ATP-binding protein EcfA2
MNIYSYKILEKKVIIKINRRICETPEELLSSNLFSEIIRRCIKNLSRRDSVLLGIFGKKEIKEYDIKLLVEALKCLCTMSAELLPGAVKGSGMFFKNRALFNDFVEYLYNYWRSFDRFLICSSEIDEIDKRPYRTFNETIEKLTHLVRQTYRDIQENITGTHPRVYRQVRAGSEIAAIARDMKIPLPEIIPDIMKDIPIIRQLLLYPPLVLNPPMNKRTGQFEKINRNPLDSIDINPGEWLCYPAKVGKLIILVYFHNKFFELGFSLCNLFELADDSELKKKPDAIYAFGVPGSQLDKMGKFPTVFYDDMENNILIAAVPGRDEFGYFGYLKKMVLTLHNIKIMKKGKFPFHGALIKIMLKGGKEATVLLIGDTGAGKSETLEAFRVLGENLVRDLIIIADDMGCLEIDKNENIIGYGSEIGAFLRLDDLQPGYAFGQMDRAIIMSPNLTNSRIIIPVNSFENIIKGHNINLVLYANNYEEIDKEHPVIEKFSTPREALKTFTRGTVMSKGTTTSVGLTHSYFANIFGPPQYREIHDRLAEKYFNAFFKKGIFVGQIRTRLGIAGYEIKGPEEAARELLKTINRSF